MSTRCSGQVIGVKRRNSEAPADEQERAGATHAMRMTRRGKREERAGRRRTRRAVSSSVPSVTRRDDRAHDRPRVLGALGLVEAVDVAGGEVEHGDERREREVRRRS